MRETERGERRDGGGSCFASTEGKARGLNFAVSLHSGRGKAGEGGFDRVMASA